MTTIFTHALVPLALGAALERQVISWQLLAAGGVCAMLPDADAISFQFNIARGSLWSHRGITHSVGFACLIGALGAFAARPLNTKPWIAFIFLALATLSHPLLDMFTNGGSGVALGFPFSAERVFFGWRPILVAPISAARFFSERGWQVMKSEFVWVWLPTLGLALSIWLARQGIKAQR